MINKLQRDLEDIKSLISILQNRLFDLEEQINTISEPNIVISEPNSILEIETRPINNKSITPKVQNIPEKSIEEVHEEVIELPKLTKDEELKRRGDACNEAGLSYELQVYNIASNCYEKNTNLKFNTQTINDIEDLNKEYDLVCQYKINNNIEDIPIELKKYRTPDWGQCNLQFNTTKKRWEVSDRATLSKSLCGKVNKLLKNVELFGNEEPIFFQKKLTPEEWYEIKKQDTTKWEDVLLDIPFNYIDEYYTDRGNNYIQISDDFGLYYIGNNDICGFGVPKFECPQKMRIRVKKVRVRGMFIKLVISASVSPINYCESLVKSPYSLDNINKLPKNIIYKSYIN